MNTVSIIEAPVLSTVVALDGYKMQALEVMEAAAPKWVKVALRVAAAALIALADML